MKKLFSLLTTFALVLSCSSDETSTPPTAPIYLDTNGVTIKAYDWSEVGDKGIIDGVEYTVVDEATLRQMVANDEDVTKVVTTKITDISSLFKEKNQFNQDLNGWDTSNVTNMSGMFYSTTAFNQNIGSWDTSSVTNMSGMFYSATAFNGDISSWDTSSVAYISGMFNNATAFNQDLSGWCVQDNFAAEPSNFKINANSTWRNDSSKQPDWDGADGSGANCSN